MQRQIIRLALLATLGCLGATSALRAETIAMKADLKGGDEVPPNTTAGMGNVAASIDTATKKMTYTITYSGLTGPATAAHFHAPAAPGANAAPVVPISGALASPIKGEATLTDAQWADLRDGKWYFNVHTAAHAGGEIRGQMTK